MKPIVCTFIDLEALGHSRRFAILRHVAPGARHLRSTAAAGVITCPRPAGMPLAYPADIVAERSLNQRCEPENLTETPSRLAILRIVSGGRRSARAIASSDFPEAASSFSRLSNANDHRCIFSAIHRPPPISPPKITEGSWLTQTGLRRPE